MIILLQCTDRIGLVADISGIMAKLGLNIVSMREYVNTEENRFFIRLQIENATDIMQVKNELLSILPQDTELIINPSPRKKIVVMVSKEYHCMGDILLRNYFDTLHADVQCVIGNHNTLSAFTEKYNIPYYYVPHENKTKAEFEAEIKDILVPYEFDYIILAKFMQILSEQFVNEFALKIINIHHSFLPAFVGGHPYRQAFERGVKLIGATAHFVTNVLDDGPIITQQIIPVTHAHSVKDMVILGKEIEKAALAKALQLVFEDRVFVFKNKTIVFDN